MDNTNASIEVIAAGHLCIDLLPLMDQLPLNVLAKPGKLYETGAMGVSTGGSVSNTGLALHRLGVNVRLMSLVGEDAIGRMVIEFLDRRDPSLTQYVSTLSEYPSSYTIVLAPERVDRIFFALSGDKCSFWG
ncbi:MAG: carbohydrate kinase family protein [Chloroflexota bacterium]|nr:carbohydrate kinase family protein [Chloroflexota bacterium]